jgi:hypothetical protein
MQPNASLASAWRFPLFSKGCQCVSEVRHAGEARAGAASLVRPLQPISFESAVGRQVFQSGLAHITKTSLRNRQPVPLEGAASPMA